MNQMKFCSSVAGLLAIVALLPINEAGAANISLPGGTPAATFPQGTPLPTPPGWTPPVAPSTQPTPPATQVPSTPVYTYAAPLHYAYAVVYMQQYNPPVAAYGLRFPTAQQACPDIIGRSLQQTGNTISAWWDPYATNGSPCQAYIQYTGSDPSGHDVVNPVGINSMGGICDWNQVYYQGACYTVTGQACPDGYTLSGSVCNLTNQAKAKKPADGVCNVVVGADGVTISPDLGDGVNNAGDADCTKPVQEQAQAQNDKQASCPSECDTK